jgi:hypothetical protein
MTTGSEAPKDSHTSLAAALAASLKAIDDDYTEEMREMRQILEEARQEAEKHEPNKEKLKALLADAGKMVQTFAALDPLWQGIQRVSRMVGIL